MFINFHNCGKHVHNCGLSFLNYGQFSIIMEWFSISMENWSIIMETRLDFFPPLSVKTSGFQYFHWNITEVFTEVFTEKYWSFTEIFYFLLKILSHHFFSLKILWNQYFSFTFTLFHWKVSESNCVVSAATTGPAGALCKSDYSTQPTDHEKD